MSYLHPDKGTYGWQTDIQTDNHQQELLSFTQKYPK